MTIPRLLVLSLGVCLILAGCEGSTSPTASESLDPTVMQETPTKPADDTTDADIVEQPYRSYVIVAVGDSITSGVGASPGTAGYPGMLEEKLRAAGYNIEVYNEGIAGANTDLVDEYFLKMTRGADIVLIMAGTNDISGAGKCFEPYNCHTIEYLRSMIEKAFSTGIVPVLGTVTPKRANDIYGEYNPEIEQLNLEIFNLAAQYGVPIVDTYNAILNNGGDALFCDKHHFNDLGYDVIANAWYDVLVTSVIAPTQL